MSGGYREPDRTQEQQDQELQAILDANLAREAFMVAGNMACGVLGDDLMARVGEPRLAAALKRPHVRVMDFTGRPSRNMVYVGPGGTKTAAAVKKWVDEVAALAEANAKAPAQIRAKKPAKRRSR